MDFRVVSSSETNSKKRKASLKNEKDKEINGPKRGRKAASEFDESPASRNFFPIFCVGLLDSDALGRRPSLLHLAHYSLSDSSGIGSTDRRTASSRTSESISSGTNPFASGEPSGSEISSSSESARSVRAGAWRTLMKAIRVYGNASLSIAANVPMNEWTLDSLGPQSPYWYSMSSKGPQVNPELLLQKLELQMKKQMAFDVNE